jgi:hypothetical protein
LLEIVTDISSQFGKPGFQCDFQRKYGKSRHRGPLFFRENGALLIVLWNAIILHARWGGLVRQRGLMVMAIFGNIVTSWSWFGVNMLGIGLHSYGFMDSAFPWLIGFGASQLAFMLIGVLPPHAWRSQLETAKPSPVSKLVDAPA